MIEIDKMRELLKSIPEIKNIQECGNDNIFKRDTVFYLNDKKYTIQWYCNLGTLCLDNLYSSITIHFDDIKIIPWSCHNKLSLDFMFENKTVCNLAIKRLDWVEKNCIQEEINNIPEL